MINESRTPEIHPATLIEQNKIRNTFKEMAEGKKSISSSYFSSQVISSNDSVPAIKKKRESKSSVKVKSDKHELKKNESIKDSVKEKSSSSSGSDYDIWKQKDN
jgi:hypothetical protein